MSQVTFASNASPSLVNLDANFTALFELREVVNTPSYSAATPYLYLNSSHNWGFGGTASSTDKLRSTAAPTTFRYNSGWQLSLYRATPASQGHGIHFEGGVGYDYLIGRDAASDALKFGADTGASFTEHMQIDGSGNLIPTLKTSAPTLSANSQMVFTLTSNTNLRISVRGSDGTTRVANITLA